MGYPYTRKDQVVRKLATGHELTIPIFKFQGTQQGPSAYFQASIHGAEVQGNAIILELIQYLSENPPLGDVVLVPLANPFGMNVKLGEYTQGRFDPTTGANWNRNYFDLVGAKSSCLKIEEFVETHSRLAWPEMKKAYRSLMLEALRHRQKSFGPWGVSYGESLALQLQLLAAEADSVLDLHTASNSVPYVYSPEYSIDSAHLLGMKNIISIENEFGGALDEAIFHPWWTLHEVLKKKGGRYPIRPEQEALTLEVGSDEFISKEKAKEIAAGIIHYLIHRGTLKESLKDLVKDSAKASQPLENQSFVCEGQNFKTVFAPIGGMVEFLAPLGKVLKKGEPLARIFNLSDLTAETSVFELEKLVILDQDCIPISFNRTVSMHEGMELSKVFTDFRVIKGHEDKRPALLL